MSDNHKYYYIKLKDNFYESEEMKMLQAMPDGYFYSDILMKMYLKSLKNNGKLMFKECIPYSTQMLSAITGHQIGIIEKAIEMFKKLGLIEVLDNGAIFMTDIQNFIGQSSTEADRIRNFRREIEHEKKQISDDDRTNVVQMYDKCTPENRDKSIDNRYKENTIINDSIKEKPKNEKVRFLAPSPDDVRAYIYDHGLCVDPDMFIDHYTSNGWMVGKTHMRDWKATLRNWDRREREDLRGTKKTARDHTGQYDNDGGVFHKVSNLSTAKVEDDPEFEAMLDDMERAEGGR